jgi:hypothetical protein
MKLSYDFLIAEIRKDTQAEHEFEISINILRPADHSNLIMDLIFNATFDYETTHLTLSHQIHTPNTIIKHLHIHVLEYVRILKVNI